MWKKIVVSQKRYYTYTLTYPEEMGGHVFYVGKGTSDRMLDHEGEAKRGCGHRDRKCRTIREIWAKGYKVQKRVVYETDIEQDALIYEWACINMIYASPHLTNAKYNVYNQELIELKRKQDKANVVRVQIEPGIYIEYAQSPGTKIRIPPFPIDDDEYL